MVRTCSPPRSCVVNEIVLLASEPASFPLSMRLMRSPKSSDVEKLRLMKSCTSVIRDGRSSMKFATGGR